MKLEEILKKRGWTDDDIKANETLLANPKFRLSLEEEYGAVASERDKFKTDYEAEQQKWNTWHQTEAIPVIDQYAKDRADAVAEAAALRARLTLAEKAGFVAGGTGETQQTQQTQQTSTTSAFDPKQHNLVTMDDVNKLAAAEGQAIAMAADLNEQYRILTGGKSLYEYIAPNGARGLTALRQEAMAQRVPLDQYVAKKFDFMGMQAKIDADRQKAHDDAIRAEERAKVVGEYGQPGTRPLMPSRHPGMFRPRDTQGKQPWELNPEEMRQRRLGNALASEMKTRVQ